jgi:hypothetical protein
MSAAPTPRPRASGLTAMKSMRHSCSCSKGWGREPGAA